MSSGLRFPETKLKRAKYLSELIITILTFSEYLNTHLRRVNIVLGQVDLQLTRLYGQVEILE